MSVPSCCQSLLAQGPCAQLTRCSCGHLHLALGPVTVRLEEAVLLSVWATLSEGVRALGHASEERALAGGPGRGGASRPPGGGWPQ